MSHLKIFCLIPLFILNFYVHGQNNMKFNGSSNRNTRFSTATKLSIINNIPEFKIYPNLNNKIEKVKIRNINISTTTSELMLLKYLQNLKAHKSNFDINKDEFKGVLKNLDHLIDSTKSKFISKLSNEKFILKRLNKIYNLKDKDVNFFKNNISNLYPIDSAGIAYFLLGKYYLIRDNPEAIYYFRKSYHKYSGDLNIRQRREAIIKIIECLNNDVELVVIEKKLELWLELHKISKEINNKIFINYDILLLDLIISQANISEDNDLSNSDKKELNRLKKSRLISNLIFNPDKQKKIKIFQFLLGKHLSSAYFTNDSSGQRTSFNYLNEAEQAFSLAIKQLNYNEHWLIINLLANYIFALSNENCFQCGISKIDSLGARLQKYTNLLYGENFDALNNIIIATSKRSILFNAKYDSILFIQTYFNVRQLLDDAYISNNKLTKPSKQIQYLIDAEYANFWAGLNGNLLFNTKCLVEFEKEQLFKPYYLLKNHSNIGYNGFISTYAGILENIHKADLEELNEQKQIIQNILKNENQQIIENNRNDSLISRLKYQSELNKKEGDSKNKTLIIIVLIIVFFLIGFTVYFIYKERLKASKAKTERDFALSKSKLLVRSLNPHIITNLKETFTYIVSSGDYSNSERLEFLDSIYHPYFNYVLEIQDKNLILIEEEIIAFEMYSKIVMYLKPFSIIKSENPDKKYFVPPLILQPLIENSIEHAFAGDINNQILLKLIQLKDRLVIEYIDNGVGIGKELKFNNGLNSIKERLNNYNIYYNKKIFSDLNISNLSENNNYGFNSGTKITFTVYE